MLVPPDRPRVVGRDHPPADVPVRTALCPDDDDQAEVGELVVGQPDGPELVVDLLETVGVDRRADPVADRRRPDQRPGGGAPGVERQVGGQLRGDEIRRRRDHRDRRRRVALVRTRPPRASRASRPPAARRSPRRRPPGRSGAPSRAGSRAAPRRPSSCRRPARARPRSAAGGPRGGPMPAPPARRRGRRPGSARRSTGVAARWRSGARRGGRPSRR